MAKIKGVNGLTYDGETFKNHATGTSFLDGTQIKNRATGEKFTVEETDFTTKEALYALNRSKEWMPMIDPEEGEIYMLFNLYKEDNFLAFRIDGTHKVEFGVVEDGKFVADDSKTISATNYKTHELTLDYDDFSYRISEDTKQVMIKISGEKITSLFAKEHSQIAFSGFKGWNVVEIWCNVPTLITFKLGDIINPTSRMMGKLEFIKLKNTTKLKRVGICRLISLKMILELDMHPDSTLLDFEDFCRECFALIYVPPIRINGSANYIFYNSGIEEITLEKGGTITSSRFLFGSCRRLKRITGDIPPINTNEIYMNEVLRITKLKLDIGSVTESVQLLQMLSLKELTLINTTGNWPNEIKIQNTKLRKENLEEILEGLTYTDTAKTISFSGGKWVESIDEAVIEETTAKGWTVVL